MKAIILLFGVLISVSSPAANCAGAFGDITGSLRWKKLPVSITIDTTVPFYYFNVIYDSVDTWNAAVGFDVLIITDVSSNLISQPIKWEFEAQEAAMTTTGQTLSYIKFASVKYNINYSLSDSLKLVTLHELGHVIGLAHIDDINDIMHYMSTQYNANQPISKKNIDTVRCLYGEK